MCQEIILFKVQQTSDQPQEHHLQEKNGFFYLNKRNKNYIIVIQQLIKKKLREWLISKRAIIIQIEN